MSRIAPLYGLGRTTLTNHRDRHLGASVAPVRTAAKGGRRSKRATKSAVAAFVPDIASPADVLAELRALYAENRALFDLAKEIQDTRLMDKAIGQAGAILDRFAKAFGMFSDGVNLTVDRSTKVLNVLGDMSEDDLRALLTRAEAGEPIALESITMGAP